MRALLRLSLVLAAVTFLGACDTIGTVPTRAVLLGVQVDDAPFRQANGDLWDGSLGGGPEIYFRLFDADVDYLAFPNDDRLNPRDDGFVLSRNGTEPWVEDANINTLPFVWDIDAGFELRDLRREYRIVLYDYDPFDSDDPMISTEVFALEDFAPDRTDGRVDTIVLEGEGADRNAVQIRLRVRYTS
jgi:hypothetical protein